MKIGLLSDTHSYLDPKIISYFNGCDEIWHAGDIGDKAVADELERIKPVRAVFGNIDDQEMQARYAEDLWFDCEGLLVWITHIGGYPDNYNLQLKNEIIQNPPALFICGHSHILKVMRDKKLNNMLHINPGAAGVYGFHKFRTMIRFIIDGKTISDLEVIELGLRGEIPK